MASVQKNKRGEGFICSYRDRSGRPRTETFAFKRDAEAFRKKWDQIEIVVKAKIRFRDAGRRFIEVLQAKGLEAVTIAATQQMIEDHINPCLGDVLANQIDADDLRQLSRELVAAHSQGQADRAVAIVRRVLRDAVVNENTFYNPGDLLLTVRSKAAEAGLEGMEHLRLPANANAIRPEDLPTYDDVRTLLSGSTGVARVLFHVGFLAGLRVCETLGLQVGDCSFEGTGTLHVRRIRRRPVRSATEVENPFAPVRRRKKVKSDAGERDVEMDPMLKQVLERHIASLGATDPAQPLFPSADDPLMPMTSDAVDYHCRKQMKRLGVGQRLEGRLKPFSSHDFRHACVSLWVHVGYDIFDISAWIGHADISTTINNYMHVLRDAELHRDELKLAA